MKCSKCGSLMIHERFYDKSFEHFDGWRCPMCSNITDPLIEEHRIHGITYRGRIRERGRGKVCKSHRGEETKA